MPMNSIQFQHGLSLPEFFKRYGTEQQCVAALEQVRQVKDTHFSLFSLFTLFTADVQSRPSARRDHDPIGAAPVPQPAG